MNVSTVERELHIKGKFTPYLLPCLVGSKKKITLAADLESESQTAREAKHQPVT